MDRIRELKLQPQLGDLREDSLKLKFKGYPLPTTRATLASTSMLMSILPARIQTISILDRRRRKINLSLREREALHPALERSPKRVLLGHSRVKTAAKDHTHHAMMQKLITSPLFYRLN